MPSVSLRDIPKAMRPKGVSHEPCPKCGNRPCTCGMDALCGQLKQRGHPLPVREYRFAAPARQWRLDGAYVAPKIAIEIEGGIWIDGRHTRGAGYENDCEKYNLAAVLGWLVLRFTMDMVSDGRALTYMERALRVRGAPTEEPEPAQLTFDYPPH